MVRVWFSCLLLIVGLTAVSTAQDTTPADNEGGTAQDRAAQELLLAKANHLFDDGDFAKALIIYNQLITLHPDSASAQSAIASVDQIIQTLTPYIVPQLLFQKLVDTVRARTTRSLVEQTVQFLQMYPDRKQFTTARGLLDTLFGSVPVRFGVTWVSPPNQALVYEGPVDCDGAPLHRFAFGDRTYDCAVGDDILSYTVTGYDPLRGASLKPLEQQTYRLREKNAQEKYRYFTAQAVHLQLKTVCTAHIFLDELTTRRGFQVHGLIDTAPDGVVTVAVPAESTFETLGFEPDAVYETTPRAKSDKTTIYEQSYTDITANGGTDRIAAKLRALIDSRRWLEAIGYYFWLRAQDQTPTDDPVMAGMYHRMREHILNTTYPDRLLEYAQFCFTNNYPITAVMEFARIIDSFPADPAATASHNYLVRLSHEPGLVLSIGSLKREQFPLTFMGFNKLAESEYMNQINYKGRSFFVGRNESVGGFRVEGNDSRTIEYYDKSLDVMKQSTIHFLLAEPDDSAPIWIAEGESYTDSSRWQIEVIDRKSGRTYPGYIRKDTLTTTDGTRYEGLIMLSANQKEVLVFEQLVAQAQPVAIKKQKIQSLHMENYIDEKLMGDIRNAIGPVAVAELHNYYRSQILAQDIVPQTPESQDLEPEPAVADNDTHRQETKKRTEPAKDEPNTVSAPAQRPKKNDADAVPDDKSRTQQDELIIRQKKIQLQKRIIRLLGLVIIIWLLYMGYKLFKSLR